MYKLLLSWRYLRTRFIAIASIVSVTLGVATLIVVNSVMSGFISEMKNRLHGILSDIEMAAPGLGEIEWPDAHLDQIHDTLGEDVLATTKVVRVPALLNFQFNGRQFTQQIMLWGIDEESFGKVSDFLPYLTNRNKQTALNFQLEESGYDSKLGECGWPYRREKAEILRQIEELTRQREQTKAATDPFSPKNLAAANNASGANPAFAANGVQNPSAGSPNVNPNAVGFPDLPSEVPDVEAVTQQLAETMPATEAGTAPAAVSQHDPHAHLRPQIKAEDLFNPARDQYTGIVLGLAISNRKFVDEETGKTSDVFLLRPGDDVQIALPTGGARPMPIAENCTVIDFYSSNMHEYDSSFAFMPLKKLQQLRGMIDPLSGEGNVSAIQIRLKPEANLVAAKQKLEQRFPSALSPFMIQTWQDIQRPILSAVDLEVTILNLLLFLIIAVAGFGILATFYMIVVEKTKDIGILKALGAPSAGVMSIFLGYGVALGAVGAGAGILLGLAFVWKINEIADLIQWITGREVFDPTVYFFSEIPTIVDPLTVAWVAAGSIAIAVLASVLPALRAARMHPVEALRYE